MPKKTVKKKKKYQAACREMAKQGLINDETGRFIPRSQARRPNQGVDDYFAGYRF